MTTDLTHADAVDFLEELRGFLGLRRLPVEHECTQATVLAAMSSKPMRLGDIARAARATTTLVCHQLREMALRGEVERVKVGTWRKTRRQRRREARERLRGAGSDTRVPSRVRPPRAPLTTATD